MIVTPSGIYRVPKIGMSFDSPPVGLCGHCSNFLRPDLVPKRAGHRPFPPRALGANPPRGLGAGPWVNALGVGLDSLTPFLTPFPGGLPSPAWCHWLLFLPVSAQGLLSG